MTGVVVTRDEPHDGDLSALLAPRGFRVFHWPAIRTAPPEDPGPLADALAALDTFDWAVFTSPRAAPAVEGVRPPDVLRVAAVGEATASSLEDVGWRVELVPETQTGEALVAALTGAGGVAGAATGGEAAGNAAGKAAAAGGPGALVGPGSRVLFPASAIARDVVPDGLEAAGAEVVRVVAYRTVAAPLDAAECRAALESGDVSVLTFTSPSTVRNLRDALGPDAFGLATRVARAVAIGPTTAEAARNAGFDDVAVADPHSLEGLADRVAELAAGAGMEEAR